MFFRKFASFCLLATAAINSASTATAQQSARGGVYPAGARSEQAARARWQPVRTVQATEELPTPPADNAASSQVQPRRSTHPGSRGDMPSQGGVVMQDAHGRSVMQARPEIYHEPLDGEIIYEGVPLEHYGEFVGPSEFGGHTCDGSCDGGCDSPGSCGPAGCGPCVSDAWRPCLTLCWPQDGWVSFEYLNWYQRGMDVPALVTTSTGPLPGRNQAGVLGGPTRVLFGGDEMLDGGFSGGRLQVGLWLDRCHTWAAVGEFFELSSESESFTGNTNGYPVLARPFFNILTGAEDSQIVSYPNFATGSLNAVVTSELVGGGFHLRRQTNSSTGCGRGLLCDGCEAYHSRTDALFGYRYVQLEESIGVTENLVGTTAGESFRIHDSFRTMNQFNGFDMGMAYNRQRGCWSVDLLVKLAIGNTRQRVDINGTTSIAGGADQTGGLLAQSTNIGSYSRDQFSVLPELGGSVGYQLTHNLQLKVGYTLIYWSSVVRPGDHIDRDVNPNLFPPAVVGGAARPHFDFDESNYWVQGVNLGAVYTW